jgi:hypothetical protein
MSENVGASNCRNPKGLHGLYRDNFTNKDDNINTDFIRECARLVLLKSGEETPQGRRIEQFIYILCSK